jgi:hypothetical protein
MYRTPGTQTDGQTDRKTDRRRDREKDRTPERQTDGERVREGVGGLTCSTSDHSQVRGRIRRAFFLRNLTRGLQHTHAHTHQKLSDRVGDRRRRKKIISSHPPHVGQHISEFVC